MDDLMISLGSFDLGAIFVSILGLFTGIFDAILAMLTGIIPM